MERPRFVSNQLISRFYNRYAMILKFKCNSKFKVKCKFDVKYRISNSNCIDISKYDFTDRVQNKRAAGTA